MVLLGVVFVIKSEWLLANFGSIAWAQQHLGSEGGSRLFYKLLGLIFIFVGMLLVTNLMNVFLMATLGRLFIR